MAQLKVINPPQDFHDRLRLRLAELPGVGGVTAVRELPYGQVFNSWNFTLDDRPEPPPGNPWWANARAPSRLPQHPGHRRARGPGVRRRRPARAAAGGGDQPGLRPQVLAGWSAAGPPHPGLRAGGAHRGVVADRGAPAIRPVAPAGAGRLDRSPEPEVYLPLSGGGLGYIAVRTAGRSPDS